MDQLSELKDKLQRNVDNRNTAVERYHEADYALSEKEDKLQRKVASLLEKEKMEMASYREVIKGSMDRLNHQQLTNNEYLAELNHNLNDMSDLRVIYETKREIMEQNHQELLTALESQENELKRRVNKLNETTIELQEKYDRTSFRLEAKKQADRIIIIVMFAFIGVVIGSWLGLGFVDTLRGIGAWFKDFFTI
ncbi:MAG: hypothetical protein GX762_00815 [Bacteroidales bacterium]|jgi:chromosome segregation ATPase|nr:hypothetical protein [Bacteroidales bacterium]